MKKIITECTIFIHNKLPEKYYLAAIYIFSVILFSLSWINQLIIGPNSFKLTVSIGMILTIMISLLIRQETGGKKYKYNKIYLVLILIIGISFLLNGLYLRVIGYLAIGLIFSVILPLFHLALARGNHQFLLQVLANGLLTSFVIFTIIAILFGPGLSIYQYTAFVRNPNTVGVYMDVVVASAAYLIYKKSYEGNKFFFEIICMAMAITMCFFAQSRTSLLAILGETTFMLVVLIPLYLVKSENKIIFLKKFISVLLMICITTVLMSVAFFYTMTTLKKEISRVLPVIQNEYVYDDGNVTTKELIELSNSRLSKGIEKKNSDEFTSGRVTIWNDFYQELSFLGHPQEGRDISFKGRIYNSTNAHNVYLQIAYSVGIVAGLSMILLMLVIIKDCFTSFYHHCRGRLISPDKIFAILSAIGFFVVSITSGGYMLYTYYTATLFWMLIFKFTVKKEQEESL